MTDTNDNDSHSTSPLHPTRHLAYMQPDATMTLREGLQEYYATIDGLVTEENASKEVADLFRFHDTCHVVFGCDTSPRGEALADTWSIFGSTVTLKTYRDYANLQETKNLFSEMTFGDMLTMLASSSTAVPVAFWRAQHMNKKWPFREHDEYLDMPLNEIRAEFGIQVVE